MTYRVDSLLDAPDANPGDRRCARAVPTGTEAGPPAEARQLHSPSAIDIIEGCRDVDLGQGATTTWRHAVARTGERAHGQAGRCGRGRQPD